MTLRTKLLLAQLPLVLAIAINGFVGHNATAALGRSARSILKDNYRSVLAAQRMKEFAERMDSGALFIVAGHREQGINQAGAFRSRFEEELTIQESNITEEGETEATSKLRRLWENYQQRYARFQEQEDTAALRDTYFADLLPQFEAVKNSADVILAINQDAMVHRSDDSERWAVHYGRFLWLVAAGGCVAGILVSTTMTTRLLRPLSVLGQAVRRFGEGDLAVRARIHGRDEIAQLGREFNAMAERLQQYRDSSLGELLEAQQAAQAAIDSLPDPVLVLAADGQITHFNEAAQSMFHFEEGALQGDALATYPTVHDKVESVRQYVLSGKGPYVPGGLEEAVRVAAAEGDRYLLPRAMPVYTAAGAISGTTLVLQDVTRLLRIEELKNDLVATVAHEFRTPLTSLRMAIHMCVEETVGPLTDKQADLLFAARDDCERLQVFVDELLDLSRIQAGKIELHKQRVDAESLVRAAAEAQAHTALQHHVRLRTEVYPGLEALLVDVDRIQLVFGNLLTNAIRYSPEQTEVTLRGQQQGTLARFEVRDQGPGVATMYQHAIFEKYAQIPGLPTGSAGLGLFIAKEIVEAHGGTIGVDSASGAGSTFWFTLPTQPAENV